MHLNLYRFFRPFFLRRFFDFLAKMYDFGFQMGMSRFTSRAYFFSFFRDRKRNKIENFLDNALMAEETFEDVGSGG